MGWGRTLLLGDVGNRLDIADCEQDINVIKKSLRGKTRLDESQNSELMNLKRENEEMKLYLAALIRLLIARGSVSKNEIAKYVELIDGEDGVVDGRAGGAIT